MWVKFQLSFQNISGNAERSIKIIKLESKERRVTKHSILTFVCLLFITFLLKSTYLETYADFYKELHVM